LTATIEITAALGRCVVLEVFEFDAH
jgi:hypothetical protein